MSKKQVHSVALTLLLTWIISVAVGDSLAVLAASDARPAAISKEDAEFFEKSVRPILSEKCYSCHSAQAQKLKGKLLLDSRQGVAKGGENGAVITGRDPDQSRLIQAIRWTDPELQM